MDPDPRNDDADLTSAPRRPSPDALICRHGDTATLLSTRSWQYFGLNATAAWIWDRLAEGHAPRTIAERLAADTGASVETVRADVGQLIARLRHRGFLDPESRTAATPRRWTLGPAGPAARPVVPSFGPCLTALVVAGARLRRAPLDPRSWLASDDTGGRDLSAAEREAAAWQMRRAAAWLPVKTFCLQQSVALVTLLRRAGVPARLGLGARPYPFVAHAWVEAGGAPVNEHDEQLAMYARFAPAAPEA